MLEVLADRAFVRCGSVCVWQHASAAWWAAVLLSESNPEPKSYKAQSTWCH